MALRIAVLTGILVLSGPAARAALLAYEPFTNAPGSALIGSGDGFGFAGTWQANGSAGLATNTGYGLTYKDGIGNSLEVSGGAGFFQGSTTASTAMQPFRVLQSSRGTNGADGVSTWISFIAARQGPLGTLTGNPYGRGANAAHDLGATPLQKLAIGNSSGAATNTVGLIPLGNSSNLKSSSVAFGGATNFIVVRIDHVLNANDMAYLFVNPSLQVEPPVASADAVSSNAFDFSFDRVRIFAGGQSSAQQPYAAFVIDEYRVGETYADVAPFVPVTNSGPGGLVLSASASYGQVTLSATGGDTNLMCYLLAATNLSTPFASWPAIATNNFDSAGRVSFSIPLPAGTPLQAFRLLAAPAPPPVGAAPVIITQPTNQAVIVGQTVSFVVQAEGTAPLAYRWFFNTNTALAGATNPVFTLGYVADTNAGSYSAVVLNTWGAATSSFAVLKVLPAGPTNGFFVAPNGSDSNPGTFTRPFLTIGKGLTAVGNGGFLYVRGGTYAISSKLTLSKIANPANMIRLWAYPGETAVIDATGNGSDSISISGAWYHLKGLTVMNAGHNGINISGNSNTVEFCTVHDNGNTGLHITGGSSGSAYPSYNLILNCDAYRNYDPPVGGNADGFSAKWNLGPGNVFRGCRAWENSDDGWDLWMGIAPVLIDSCWAFRQGINIWGSPDFNGNGNGFKLGGNYVGAAHHLIRCVAFGNHAHGIDQNNNILGQTIDQNTAWANGGRNFSLNHGTNTTPHVVRNNLSIAGTSGDAFSTGTLATNNSWQVILPAPNAGDVLSLDASVATGPRQADGSLPVWPFLRPVPTGRLVDKGINIGEPFYGAAPDLGGFETSP